jgi:cytochrome c oxidase subunit 2
VKRATLGRLIAAMIVVGTVIAVPMIQINWNGEAASTQRDKIDTLLDVMIVLSSYVFAIVIVMLGYSVWKYRAKPGDESDGEPIHGNTKLEIAWTLIPTIIVLFGAGYSWVVLNDIEAKASNRMEVDVTAQQYKWTFSYPEQGGFSSNELHVPVGTQLELHLTAVDVIHSFWVEEWGIKRDLVPQGPKGNDVDDVAVVTPDKEGTFTVQCTELCGYGHSTMRAFAYVQSQAQFDQWAQQEAKANNPPPPTNVPSGGGSTTTTTTGSS